MCRLIPGRNAPKKPWQDFSVSDSKHPVRWFVSISQWIAAVRLRQAALFVLCFGLAERFLLWLVYGPVAYSDTASYRRLAEAILSGWTNYDGTRVPGYPMFMALAGPDSRVYLAQLLLA